jgi:hypothetical protein
MNDLENRLGSYRPAGPPPDLRGRILRRAQEPRRETFREWLPAIAAAAAIALLFAFNYQLHVRLDARLSVPEDLRPVEQWPSGDAGGWR